jgi:serine/threonine protein kinase
MDSSYNFGPAMAVENPVRIGDVLDAKYRIESLVGQGGMGAVYRATHLHTTRTVAVKVIRPHLTRHQEFIERFRREAEAAGRLRHPNVVDVTDFGFAAIDDGQVAYLVMEYLDGCTLADILVEENRLPVSWTVDILEQVASALDEAHQQGIVHRDLKPENVWLEPNRRGGYTVKVLDFGLVKLGDLADPSAESSALPVAPVHPAEDETVFVPAAQADAVTISGDVLTRFGSVTGTPTYMSPEQCRGDQVDGRSDIYSLGVIAYRLLAGEPPFTGDAAAVMRRHLGEPAPSLRTRAPHVPRGVARVVMSALAKDAAARPSRAGGFASALRAAAEGSGTLLRQAIALYSERLPVLLRLSILAYVPLMLFLVGLAIVDARGSVSGAAGFVVIVTMIALNIGTYLAIPAIVTPIVFQAFVAPLRPTSLSDAWAVVRRRWKPLALATAMVVAITAAWSLLLIVPGVIAAVAYVLYAPVVIMEDCGAREALRRARRLARRAWSTVVIITALHFTLPLAVWFSAVDMKFAFRMDENWELRELGLAVSGSWSSALYQLLDVFVAPLTATMTVLLYLKSRQAGGERLQLRESAAGSHVTRWRRAMQSRSRPSSGALVEPPTPSPACPP